MLKTLLTTQEAVIRSELGAKFPQCELSEILQTEEWEFRKCLGWDLLGKMLAAQADYCNANEWVAGTYSHGEVVKNRGTYWISKRGGNVTEPLAENQYWCLAPKFDPNCNCDSTDDDGCGALYNDLWCRYLARYLSLKVAKLTIPRIAINATGNGVVRSSASGMIPADHKEIAFLVQGIETQAIQVFDNMMAWIKRQDNEVCLGAFDEWCKPIKCEDKLPTGCEAQKPYTVGVSVY